LGAEFLRDHLLGSDSGGEELPVGNRLELVDLAAGEAEGLERCGRNRLLRLDTRGGVGLAVAVAAAALRHDLVEEPLGRRRVHHPNDLPAAARLAEDRDVAGIPAEGLDIVVHPLQGGHQVGGPGVAGVRVLGAVGREVERADDVQPVVHADSHDVAELGECLAVIGVRFDR
jgi:hypothetical protein